MINRLAQFLKSISGNITLLTALTLPILITLAGGAIEYNLVVSQKQRLKAAADSAALAAVNEASIAYRGEHDVDLEELIETIATSTFEASISKEGILSDTLADVTANVLNNRLSVDVQFSANYDSIITGLAGVDQIALSGVSSATISTASFVNINLVFDVSHSMGIGATIADQQQMGDLINCAFACHIGGSNNSSYRKVQASDAQMRIDVARNAALNAINTANSITVRPDQITYSVYEFDNELHEILPIGHANASDINFVQSTIANSIELTPYDGGTNIENALQQLQSKIPRSGSGSNSEDRLQYVVVLTDGVESTQARLQSGGWIQHPDAIINSPSRRHAHHEVNYALNSDVCNYYNANNIDLYFIYTEYDYPGSGNFSGHNQQRFGFIQDTLFPIIPDRFESCTQEPRNLLKASTPAEISKTFSEILGDIATPLRLN